LNDTGIIAATAAGGTLAFLWFNIYPAEVFMGDVGSMGLGALISGLAIMIHKELAFALIGGVFVMEAASVIIQVSFFKAFKRRIFKMTPIHHHFELMGISEPFVVLIFAILGIIFAAAGISLSSIL
jgi:phospho-N-acetylmuramoyl-pentapeptide-transferase